MKKILIILLAAMILAATSSIQATTGTAGQAKSSNGHYGKTRKTGVNAAKSIRARPKAPGSMAGPAVGRASNPLLSDKKASHRYKVFYPAPCSSPDISC